jgi:hypothetical protein
MPGLAENGQLMMAFRTIVEISLQKSGAHAKVFPNLAERRSSVFILS